MIRIAVIGYGYWGPNLVRNFMRCDGAIVAAIVDRDEAQRAAAGKLYPAVELHADPTEVIDDPDIDAVIVATPVESHFDLAMRSLRAGKHVLVEKPMTASVPEAEQLVAEAERRSLTLMVDHTFVYTSAVRRIRSLIEDGSLGDLYYYDSVRVNLGLFQTDVSVVWDLAVHDLSIMDYLVDRSPVRVSATGMAHLPDQPVNLAYLAFGFDDPMIGHLHVNWLAPVKVRKTLICGSERMVVFDDIENSEKVKVYDKGITLTDAASDSFQRRVGYRSGDMWAPRLDNIEALEVETRHFVECVENGSKPITDGQAGLRVVRALSAASRSLSAHGRPVAI